MAGDQNKKPFPSSLSQLPLIDSNILQQNDLSITKDLLFHSEKLKDDINNALLMSLTEFIQTMERFK